MLSLRDNVPIAEPRAIPFSGLNLTSLDPNAISAWNLISRKVHSKLNITEESGIDWDVKGTKRAELRELVLELKDMQKIWKKTPDLVLGLEKLAQTVARWHDLYEQLGTCMTSLNELGLVLGEKNIREGN